MCFCFVCKQKTAYELRMSDWSSDVCSSYLGYVRRHRLAGLSICHETIYQYVYGEGRSQGLWRHLPCARRSRRQRDARKPRGVHIPMANTIKARPAEIGHRSSFGHWEGDLLDRSEEPRVGKGGGRTVRFWW